MAEERPETQDTTSETGAREKPPLTAEQFEVAPEFRRFKRGMKKLLKVSKTEIDRRVGHGRKQKAK